MKAEYFKINDPDLRRTIREVHGENTGTYILHWFQGEKPREICRLLGTDYKGILYIGKTDTPLYKRVTSLQDSIISNSDLSRTKPVEKGHNTLSKKFFRIRKSVQIADLYVIVQRSKVNPGKDESYLLDKYASEYGELPPLNGNYGKYEHWRLF